jgi:preprotein translocase subunit SecB
VSLKTLRKTMSENYKIISKFIKDISGETPNIETYLYVKDFISKYQLNIEINSKPLKAQIIEVNTLLKFHDTSESKKKSHFEMTYTSVIKLNEEIKDKKILQKIILCDVQKEIYPELEKALLNLLHTSGYPNIKFEKKVDFDELYNKQFN